MTKCKPFKIEEEEYIREWSKPDIRKTSGQLAKELGCSPDRIYGFRRRHNLHSCSIKICPTCSKEFSNGAYQKYCSFECSHTKKICLTCGKEFSTIRSEKREQIFCSRRCRFRFRIIECTCLSCGKKFYSHGVNRGRGDIRTRKYCSRKCFLKSAKLSIYKIRKCVNCGNITVGRRKFCSMKCCREYERKSKPPRICPECGKEFFPNYLKSQQKYCSAGCSNKAFSKRFPEKVCLKCGKKYHGRSIYCSRECRILDNGNHPQSMIKFLRNKHPDVLAEWEFERKHKNLDYMKAYNQRSEVKRRRRERYRQQNQKP